MTTKRQSKALAERAHRTDRIRNVPDRIQRIGEPAIPLYQLDDFLLVHAFLYHGGEHRDYLTESEHDRLMEMCDGYGSMTRAQLRRRELIWDWSHVRDSSTEAIARVATEIRLILVQDKISQKERLAKAQIDKLKKEIERFGDIRSTFNDREQLAANLPVLSYHFNNTVCELKD